MKNIFKFMGIALIASSMVLVGCQKDNTNDTNTNNNTNQQEETYKLTLKVNDGAMGSVAANPQKESYKKGDTVVLTATANTGYKFANWSDANTDNPRTIVISANATYTAQFVEDVPMHATVSFGTYTWTSCIMGSKQATNGSCMLSMLFENPQDDSKPQIYMQNAKTTGTFAAGNGTPYFIEYYNNAGDTLDIDGYTSGGWQPYSFSHTITEFDMNESLIAFTATAGLYRYEDAEFDPTTGEVIGFGDAERKDLSMDVKITWLPMNKKMMKTR